MTKNEHVQATEENANKVRWLILSRFLFATLIVFVLLWQSLKTGSYKGFHSNSQLYSLVGFVYIVSIIYFFAFKYFKSDKAFVFIQLLIDTFISTLLIYSTGSYFSLYSFLYLIVIICTSIFFNRRITIVIALLCGIQFGIMIDLEFYEIIMPPLINSKLLSDAAEWNQVFNKILITMAACLATALLSSFISEQEKKAKIELQVMQEHVKRVEKLAAAGEIAAGLAHEIKNPLASLSGSIQMLSEIVEFNPEYDRLMKISLREAERLGRLVDDFMQFAKPLQGKNEPLKPGLIIDEVIDLFLKDKKIDKKIRISRDLSLDLWVQIDPGHLKQVILNILLNAVDATPKEGTIYIRLYKKNRFVCISIKDEGPGVSDENRQLIFDPFFTTRPKGAGLGLSIAHRILNAYNGNIELHNHKDSLGAEFIINLPEISRP